MISDRHFEDIQIRNLLTVMPKTHERIHKAMRREVAAAVWAQRKQDIDMGLSPSERKVYCSVDISGLMLIDDNGEPFGGILRMPLYPMIDAAFSAAMNNPYLTIQIVGYVRRECHGCAVRSWVLPIHRILGEDIRWQTYGCTV